MNSWEFARYRWKKQESHRSYSLFEYSFVSDKDENYLEGTDEHQIDGMEINHKKVTHWEVGGSNP